MNVYFKTLGCRLNEAELEQWGQAFQKKGCCIVSDLDQADIIILNSCAVTMEAGRKSRRHINRLYRENPEARLVVTGCYATLNHNEIAEHLGVDLVISNEDKDILPDKVIAAFMVRTMPIMAQEPAEAPLFIRGRQRAFIKIQDGCRYRCTFCIVTVARGEERSRPIIDIINEINYLFEQDLREIVLTGVHVGGYGSDIGSSLFELVKAILSETNMPRIRFASVEPWDLHDDFFTLFENSRLMPHMHLPLQSGSDSVLRRMSRRCKTDDFALMVKKIRAVVPHFNITTDIIVGFPAETDEEWQSSMDYIEQIGFGHIHIFSYSPREGTKAARLANPISSKIKKERSQALHLLSEKLKFQFFKKQLTHNMPVLWEKGHRLEDTDKHIFYGYTPNYVRVETIISNNKASIENKILTTELLSYSMGDKSIIGQIKTTTD